MSAQIQNGAGLSFGPNTSLSSILAATNIYIGQFYSSLQTNSNGFQGGLTYLVSPNEFTWLNGPTGVYLYSGMTATQALLTSAGNVLTKINNFISGQVQSNTGYLNNGLSIVFYPVSGVTSWV